MKIALYLTNQCNVKQGYCYDWLACGPDKKDSIFDIAKSVIDDAKENGFDILQLSGGEATLEMGKLLDIIRYGKDRMFEVWFKTNGWWGSKNEEYPKLLHEAGLDHLRISYDSNKFYPGSPITEAIVLNAIAYGHKYFMDRRFTIVVSSGEKDFSALEALKVNGSNIAIEKNVILDSHYRFVEHFSSIDPDTNLTVAQDIGVPFRFTVDFKGRVFTNSEGIAEAEHGKILGSRYVGDIRQEKFIDLYNKYLQLTK